MKVARIGIITAVYIALTYGLAEAQISSGGQPVSFQKRVGDYVPMISMPAVDAEALLAEDERDGKLGVPFRFGYKHDVSLNPDNSGVWETLDDGGRLWRLAIKCPEAYSINLVYDQYRLPEGARLFVYSDDRNVVLGAFTSGNNKEHGKFATAPTRGDVTILEYYLPPGVDDPGLLSLVRVVHAYKDIFFGPLKEVDPTEHFGHSDFCEINVNCPEGEPWKNEVRSVVMYIVDEAWQCSGVMVNNVREDQTPYMLTANHCHGPEETILVVFNYQSPSCENIVGPGDMTLSGATLVAANDYSDFKLVQLSEQPPASYDVYYAGWSAIDIASQSSVCIHHPEGDIKKISFDDDSLLSADYLLSYGDSHWRVGNWELGTTESGSSGSPLFDPEHRIVGQLHGGMASCRRIKPDWYGKFSKSWDYGTTPETRLKDWLDPDNTGTLVLDGLDTECCVGMTGNIDGDPYDIVDPMDIVYLAEWMWAGGPAPPCMEEVDVDGSGYPDLMDAVYLVTYFWEGGPPPVDCP
ncbi:MAG: trypsin-like peptidase domain-containing protein [Candidatus Zixiibacteriota bacterium]|nr:MAG: trypsin-like peptidase domain-containing protein [candidate division Zixibacteria bacterium]